jgi:hypothetical protein
LAGRQLHRARIGKAAHASHCAEVVVEGSILLHQNHDVLDVFDGAGPVVRRDRQRPAEVERQRRRQCRRADQFEECSTVSRVHRNFHRRYLAQELRCEQKSRGRLSRRCLDKVSAIR